MHESIKEMVGIHLFDDLLINNVSKYLDYEDVETLLMIYPGRTDSEYYQLFGEIFAEYHYENNGNKDIIY